MVKHISDRIGVMYLGKMVELADAAARDDGDVHSARYGTRERAVKAVFAAIAIHAGQQNLAGTASRRLGRPLDSVDARRRTAARHVNLPFVGAAHVRAALRVDGNDDGLRAESNGRLRDQARILHGCGIHRYLVGARRDHLSDVGNAAKAPAHRIRQMQLLTRAAGQLDCRRSVIARRRDVQEHDLVGALLVVSLRKLDRVACVAQIHKVHAFHDATVFDVHARYHAFRKHFLSFVSSGSADRAGDGRAMRIYFGSQCASPAATVTARRRPLEQRTARWPREAAACPRKWHGP